MNEEKNKRKAEYDCCISYNGKTIWYKGGHETPEVKEMYAKMLAEQKAQTEAIRRRTAETRAKTERLHQECIRLEEKRRKLEEKNFQKQIWDPNYYKAGGNYMYNNSTVSSVADARRAQQIHDFNEKVKRLRSDIEYRMKRRLEDKTPELQQANAFMAAEMKKLLERPIYNEKDYEYVYWLFNYGDLRTEAEINARHKAENDAHYVLSGQYERDCFVNKSAWGWGGFLIPFFLCLLISYKSLWIFSIPISAMIGCIGSLIGMAIASKENIDNAREHGVPSNHPRLQHDKNELKMAAIGSIAAAASIGHHAYKAGKDLADVDHWPKQK